MTKAANDKKQALASAEINIQKIIRNVSIGIGCILVLVAIAGIIVYKRRKDAIAKKKEAEFNAQVADIIRCKSDINYTTIYLSNEQKLVVAKTL